MEENMHQDSVLPIIKCPTCHIEVRQTDYFCFNCGKNLHPKPLSISPTTQIAYYIGSIILLPMGIIWGFKYLKESNPKAKIVGIICIALTIIVLVIVVNVTVKLINTVNDQVNSQMQNIMQF
jgi:hypothetical protein